MPSLVTRLRPRSAGPRALALAAVTGSVAALAVVLATPAAAAAPGPHDPVGLVTSYRAVTGGLLMNGWTFDPDARRSNVTVIGMVDGRTVAKTARTSKPYAPVHNRYKTGPTPAFTLTVPLAKGRHTVCLIAHNAGAGLDNVLRCLTTPLGTRLTSAQTVARRPVGTITHAWANKHSVHFMGWASDPDDIPRRSTVVLYVDGHSAATVTTKSHPRPRPTAAGWLSNFDILVPVSVGTHVGCIWVVNVGLGSGNTFLGCRTMDTRGPAGTRAVATPALNKKVIAEAKKHIGQPYVWGAIGPKKFDCSGLVMYSYGKFGYRTPRVSEDQVVAARLIPASRAVPGDLVFYHDTQGDVYHVGIYLSPGRTVAAIDTDLGVDYQNVWDPSSTTYGSFTHT